ncbi:MAG: S41 family peptidase [Candidatus Cryptobacteroides sp.]|nr:S41 family peptidase [Candidatus Cryptobacteroides sp.]
MKRIVLFFSAIAVFSLGAHAQSKDFSLGKWVEVNNAILKELNRSYVDSLQVGRIERAGINAMLEALDPYTLYIPEEEQEDFQMMLNSAYGGVGAIIYKPDVQGNVVINEPYEGSPAALAGLRCGDEVVAIDGQAAAGLTSAECSEKMRGKPGTTVVLTVKKLRAGESWKAGDVLEVPVVRRRIVLPSMEYAGMLNEADGYIYLSKFTEGVGQEIRDAYKELKTKGMKRLVLDLRGNGGGIMGEAVNIVSLFIPKGSVVVSAKGKAATEQVYKTTTDPVDTEIPIVVLVDNASASASEIVSGALQDYDRATIIGTRTYGKGLVQSIRPLPYDGQLKLTTAKYYTPSGRCVQAIDYSHRNEDGSVGHIPDSLTHAFTTAHGRTVRDGGGITPDFIVKPHKYSRLTYSLVYSGVIEQYALDYVRAHERIPALEDFHFTDYEEFIAFAKDKEFDYRSSARALFDEMKKSLEEDGLTEALSGELNALQKSLEMDKETFLRLKKEEIVPFIEEEIAVRYYFQQAGIRVRLRYDDQLHEALQQPAISW